MKNQKGYTLFELIFVVAVVVSVLTGVAVAATAVHFIIKFW